MTEDDTFRALCRPSFTEMTAIIVRWVDDLKDFRGVREILIKNCWTVKEYNQIADSKGLPKATHDE